MSELITQFHFLRPWWLMLALAWLPLLAWRVRAARGGAAFTRLADAVLLPWLLVGTRRARWAGPALALLGAALATLALAGPAWQRLPQPLYADGAAQVVVVSLSRRMLARDVQPDRMDRVRLKVRDLLHANPAGRNGVVAYAGDAFTVAPLTTDAHALDDLVQALAPDVMPVAGNAAATGIARGVKLLQQGGAQDGSLVVVTDTAGAAAIAAARAARAAGIRVSVLGVGKPDGVPVTLANGSLLTDAAGNVVIARRDDASLRALAAAGGGTYVPMREDHSDVAALEAALPTDHGTRTPSGAQGNQWRDMGPWLLLPLLMLAALSFRRGWLLLVPLVALPCVVPPVRAAAATPASAGSVALPTPIAPGHRAVPASGHWTALFHNADQRAAHALALGQPERARSLARSPGLRGAAAYRSGDYGAAATAFAAAPGSDGAYNLGNALARQGDYRQAIKAYDQALRLDAGNVDARANRKAVEDWLHEHQPPSRPKSGSHSGQGGQAPKHASPAQGRQRGQPAGAHSAPAQPASSPAQATSSSKPSMGKPSQPAPDGSSAPAHRAPAAGARQPGYGDATPDARAARQQRAEAQRAGRALERELPRQPGPSAPTFNLGAMPARATSIDPLPQSMQRALERVPDDPGGLLRRKFLLEYQQRQSRQGGGGA